MADRPTHLEILFGWILENVTPEDLTPDNRVIIEYDGLESISIGDPNSQPGEDQKETRFCLRTPKIIARNRKGGYYRIEKDDEEGSDAGSIPLSESGAESDGPDAAVETRVGRSPLRTANGGALRKFMGENTTVNGGDTETSAPGSGQIIDGNSITPTDNEARALGNSGPSPTHEETIPRGAFHQLQISNAPGSTHNVTCKFTFSTPLRSMRH